MARTRKQRTLLAAAMSDFFEVEKRPRGMLGDVWVLVAKDASGGRHDVAGPFMYEGPPYEIAGRLWEALRTWVA